METKEICYACHAELVPVYEGVPQRRSGDEPDFRNALRILFSGGYGMIFDENSKKVVICHDCAIELIHRVPWIESVLEL